MSATAAFT